ncbi:MAG: pyridoxal phosphate-dependent aminotransferase [Thermoplasmataceae archaeon]
MFPQDVRLLRWIEERMHLARYNLSLSGLPEPDFQSMGVNTSLEDMKRETSSPDQYFINILSDLYGYDPAGIFLTTGGSEAIFLISLMARAMDASVFTGVPEYEPIFNVPANMGVRTVTAPFDKLPEILTSASGRKAVFMSNPNNPLGSLHDRKYLKDVRGSVSTGDFVYVDEAFLEFTLKDRPESVYDGNPDIMVNGSMTKFYGFSGMRVGWIVTSPEKIRILDRLRDITGTRNPTYPLWIAGQCLLNRKRFQERARTVVEPNLRLLSSVVKDAPALSWVPPRHAPFALIKYSGNMDSVELCTAALEKYGLFLDPGDYFGQPKSFRLCFTGAPDEFKESMEVFSGFVRETLG